MVTFITAAQTLLPDHLTDRVWHDWPSDSKKRAAQVSSREGREMSRVVHGRCSGSEYQN